MNHRTRKYLILVCALLGVMMFGQTMAANIRYKASGNYMLTTNDTANVRGWQWPYVPDWEHTIRVNWGGNTVTLSDVAPEVLNFQICVDESGHLIVTNGGKLTATGAVGGSLVGNNGGDLTDLGRLTVTTGGEVIAMTSAMKVGADARGVVTIDGGTLTAESHLWVGCSADPDSFGTNYIKNGGVMNVRGMIGLGTVNSTTAAGGRGFVYVQTNGTLNLANIQAAGPTNADGTANPAYLGSIQPGSQLDIVGNGLVTLPGNFASVISNYVAAGRITSYGGLGTVEVKLAVNEFDVTNTWITAIAPFLATSTVWNPAANPSGSGHWNEATNWTSLTVPADITKVTFNVPDAIPCTITNAAVAKYIVMGDAGPGGSLIIANGGGLACTADNWSAVGYDSNALMVVENGGSASFGSHLWIGLNTNANGTLTMNGGTVSVAGMFGLGWMGGKGTANINGGTLNLSQWSETNSIQGASVLNVAGTGLVVITGNHVDSISNYVSAGKITAGGGAGTLVVDYDHLNAGKTTLYVSGAYVPPEQVIWNPLANPSTTGKWNESANWTGLMVPAARTKAIFNVVGATPCTITNAAVAKQVVIGDTGGPGGTVTIANGGSLTTVTTSEWSAVGYSSNGLMVVEAGGTANFGQHLWVGFNPGAVGTLVANGGTVTVVGAFGLGYSGGQGFAHINSGGTLNLGSLAANRIVGASVLDIAGTGKVVVNGDVTATVSEFVTAGKITASGGPNVLFSYDAGTSKTTITSGAPLPPPAQSLTGVAVNNGIVSVTYQTTAGYSYYIEGTPSLTPATWTPVTGSTNSAATGVPVTFTFPAGAGNMFYRTVAR